MVFVAIVMGIGIAPCLSCAKQPATIPESSGNPSTSDYAVPGEIIVQFHRGTSSEKMDEILEAAGVGIKKRMVSPLVLVVRPLGGRSVPDAIADLQRHKEVQYAEPNRLHRMLDMDR